MFAVQGVHIESVSGAQCQLAFQPDHRNMAAPESESGGGGGGGRTLEKERENTVLVLTLSLQQNW